MKTFFNCIIILRFGETKVAKENFYGVKKPIFGYLKLNLK